MTARTLRALIVVVVVCAVGTGAWWLAHRPPAPQPPTLDDPDSVDPAVAALIEKILGQVQRSPRDKAARAKLAMAYHANGLATLAHAAYDQAISLDHRNAHLWRHLAHLRADQSDLPGALQALERSINLDGSHAPLHWQRGFWLLDLGRIDEAKESFRMAVELQPNQAAGRVGLARVHLQRKEYAQAAAELMDALAATGSATPNLPYVRQLLGTAERHMGQLGPALRHLTMAGSAAVSWPDTWESDLSNLCVGYHASLNELERLIASGQHERATERAGALLESKPGDVAALNWQAIAHLSMQNWDAGLALLHEALESNPDHYATHLNLTEAYEGKGDPAAALTHAQRAVQINPGSGRAHLAVGRLLVLADRHEEAIEPLTAAVRAGANQPQVRVLLGETLMKLNRWPEAVKVFEQAAHSAPESAEVFAGLALARAETGALPQARMALQMALRLNPRLPALEKAAIRINEIEAIARPPRNR